MSVVKGSCMCGAVEIQYTGEPAARCLCHCTDCQKWAGSAFSSNILVPRSAFKVNKGTVKEYDAVALSGKINKHHFCTNCGSSLFNYLEAVPDVAVIKAGCLDGGAASLDNKVDVEYFSKDRVAYLKEIAGAEQNPIF